MKKKLQLLVLAMVLLATVLALASCQNTGTRPTTTATPTFEVVFVAGGRRNSENRNRLRGQVCHCSCHTYPSKSEIYRLGSELWQYQRWHDRNRAVSALLHRDLYGTWRHVAESRGRRRGRRGYSTRRLASGRRSAANVRTPFFAGAISILFKVNTEEKMIKKQFALSKCKTPRINLGVSLFYSSHFT